MTLKVYANEHPRNKKKKDINLTKFVPNNKILKVASASQIKKNEKISNKILNELMSDYILKDLKKSIKKKKK
jgi:hypothetical protein